MHEGFTDLNPEVKPVGPNLAMQTVNLVKALPDILKSRAKLVPDDVYEVRLATCNTCYFWDNKGNMGFGKCTHPKCGCSKAKLRLAISSCPIDSWRAYAS